MMATTPRLSVHTIGFGERPFADIAAELDRVGVRTVGVPMMQLSTGDPGANRAAIAHFDVLDVVQPSAFTLADPARWPAERETLVAALDVAKEIGAELLYTTSGPGHGCEWDDAAARFADAVGPVAAYARALGLGLAVENTLLLRSDLSFVHRLADAVDLARVAGISVCADLFSAWNERGLTSTIRSGADTFALVQVADYVLGTFFTPGRAVPGDGVVAIAAQLTAVLAAGYAGPIEMELSGPRITQEGPAAASARALSVVTELLTSAMPTSRD
jgi:sugar phosphate isomerase/epimerase